jgi:hypothetical protein
MLSRSCFFAVLILARLARLVLDDENRAERANGHAGVSPLKGDKRQSVHSMMTEWHHAVMQATM